jgi:hypothetical protein
MISLHKIESQPFASVPQTVAKPSMVIYVAQQVVNDLFD